MTNVIVRFGKVSDAKVVSALLRQTWAKTYANVLTRDQLSDIAVRWHGVEILEKQIQDTSSCFLVAELNDQIVGHALARLKPEAKIWLSKLYVLPTSQNQGVGKALFVEILKSYPNADSICLEVGPENQQAIDFYQRSGFIQIGTSNSCGGDLDTPALMMEKVL